MRTNKSFTFTVTEALLNVLGKGQAFMRLELEYNFGCISCVYIL